MERDKEFVSAMAEYVDAVLEALEDIVGRVALWEMDIQRKIRQGNANDELFELRDLAYSCHGQALIARSEVKSLLTMFKSMD